MSSDGRSDRPAKPEAPPETWRAPWSDRMRGALKAASTDLVSVARRARRSPVFSLTIVASLASGIGLATAIFTFADGYLFRPPALPEPDRLFYVQHQNETFPYVRTPDSAALRASELGYLGFVDTTSPPRVPTGSVLRINGREVVVWIDGVTEGLGSIVRAPLALGRHLTTQEYRTAEPVPVLLVHRFWEQQFGRSPDVVGRQFTTRGRRGQLDIVVVGVLDRRIATLDPEYGPSRILPDMIAPALPPEPSPNTGTRPMVRLPESMSREQAEAAIAAALRSIAPDRLDESGPVQLIPVGELQTAAGRPMAASFFAGALLALVLTGVNLTLLLLTRTASRQQELATRVALGASAWAIARLCLLESLVYGAVGIGGGLLSGYWMATSFAAGLPTMGNRGANLGVVAAVFDARVIGFAAVAGTIVALVSGVLPAWRARSMSIRTAARTQSASGAALSARFSKTVLTAEVAVSMVVGVAAVFAGLGIWRYLHQPIGIDLEDRIRLSFEAPDAIDTAVDWPSVLDAVRRVPGVRAAAVAYPAFVRGPVFVGSRELGRDAGVRTVAAGADYFRAWGQQTVAGRWPTPEEIEADAPLVVVDERFARSVWPGLDPVGMFVRTPDGQSRSVVGVVRHRLERLAGDGPGTAYVARGPLNEARTVVVWAPGVTPAALRGHVSAALEELAPGYTPLAQEVTFANTYSGDLAETTFQTPILIVFGLFGAFVAGVGLFGLAAYLLEQRWQECGLRLALGASRGDIVWHVMWQTVSPALAGTAIGAAVSWPLHRVIEATMFGWESSGPFAIVLMGILLLLVAALASVGPAWRAGRCDAIAALRAD